MFPLSSPRPDHFWRWFAVTILALVSIPIVIAILGLLAAIAIPNFVRARQQSQQNAARQWTQEGWQLWQAQKMDQAAAKFQQAVQLAPDNADAWNGLGWAMFNSGNPQEAEPAFQKAVSLDTNQPGALNGLGQIYLSQGKYDQAETYLLRAAPQAPAAWHGLTRLYLLEGKFDAAESWAQKIVDSGQADDVMRRILNAAKEKHLDAGLRLMIEPLTANAPPASAETWSPTLAPGEKPDLQKIQDEAKTLMEQGRYEDALQRHLWYFNHALEYDPAQTGVRLSFALSQWVELGRRYPKAKEALIEIRDRDARMLVEGKGYANLFTDVQAINRELQDENATYDLFKTIREKDPQLAGQCYFWVESLLVAKGEYQWCYDHMDDPQSRFDSIRRLFDLERANHKRMAATQQQTREMIAETNRKNGWTNAPSFSPPDTSAMLKKSTEDRFVGQVRQLIEILVATGHKTDAENIRDQAVAGLDDPRLKSAVIDAEVQVKKVGEGSGTASPKTNRYFVTRLNQIIKPAQASTNVTATPPGLKPDELPSSGKAVPGSGYIDPATRLPVTNAWHARVEQLRQRLEQNPQAGIPELKFLTEYDWLEAAKDDLKTDADYRRALNHLRVAGETHFVDSQLQPALKIYVEANHGKFPADLAQLQPFFQPPVDGAILQRYEIVPHEKVPDAHWGGDWVVTQKSPVDRDYDRRLVVGAEGGWGRIPF